MTDYSQFANQFDNKWYTKWTTPLGDAYFGTIITIYNQRADVRTMSGTIATINTSQLAPATLDELFNYFETRGTRL